MRPMDTDGENKLLNGCTSSILSIISFNSLHFPVIFVYSSSIVHKGEYKLLPICSKGFSSQFVLHSGEPDHTRTVFQHTIARGMKLQENKSTTIS